MARDILLDDDGDLLFRDGDLVIGESDNQDIQLLIGTNKGEWKESPLVGAGVIQLLKSREAAPKIKREINLQLANDGFKVKKVVIDYPNISIDAKRI